MNHDSTPDPAPGPAPDPFLRLRPRLRGIAYRMLGSAADADEVVQDAWLRWHEAERGAITNAEAWLVAVTTRLAIDRLRAAKARREDYVGTWLPEPILTATDGPHTPEQMLERADQLSVAFLALLERLAPEEQQRLLRAFADAAALGDLGALKAMLAEDAKLISDGGGKVPSFGAPLLGGPRIAQLYMAVSLRFAGRVHYELDAFNGEWGLLRFIDGALESAQALQIEDGRIRGLHVQRNPDKLRRIAEARGHRLLDPDVTRYDVTKRGPAAS